MGGRGGNTGVARHSDNGSRRAKRGLIIRAAGYAGRVSRDGCIQASPYHLSFLHSSFPPVKVVAAEVIRPPTSIARPL
jgi:hypothetical protein